MIALVFTVILWLIGAYAVILVIGAVVGFLGLLVVLIVRVFTNPWSALAATLGLFVLFLRLNGRL